MVLAIPEVYLIDLYMLRGLPRRNKLVGGDSREYGPLVGGRGFMADPVSKIGLFAQNGREPNL